MSNWDVNDPRVAAKAAARDAERMNNLKPLTIQIRRILALHRQKEQ